MKQIFVGLIVAIAALAMVTTAADAKRLGGGKSTGLQRDMPARNAPDAPPAKPATPQGAQQAAPGAPAAAAAPAAAPKRSWLGPIAGIAAGLGIAALMSHLGLGEAFGNFIVMLLLALVAFFVIRFVMRRFFAARRPAVAYGAAPAAGAGATAPQVSWPGGAAAPRAEPRLDAPAAPPDAAAAVTKAFVPAVFDAEGFERAAKMIFLRLQAANDSGDLEDLRSFTTPEMFAALKLDILDRGSAKQTTDVLRVEAKVLDVADEAAQQIVSVRFSGEAREEEGAAPVAFNEVWHLVRPHDESRSWAVAGIEQTL
jgi:predicted lipid-binding transport protein (Tim44 family)